MPTPMTIQSDVDAALSDYATKLAAAEAAIVAMYTVEFPATSYANASAQADAIKAAGKARDAIAKQLGAAQANADAVGSQIKSLLPIS